jgi:hypothetical protein
VAESEAERPQREHREVEAQGERWAERSDSFLVGYVSQLRGGSGFHTPAIVEMQRCDAKATHKSATVQERVLPTIETFNQQSATYERRIEWLTWAMLGLAAAQFVAAIRADSPVSDDLEHDPGYQRSLEVHREIEALYSRIEAHSAFFRGMVQTDPTIPHPPGMVRGVQLARIACAIAIKAATTKRAVLALCELVDGDNALALARVLLENACLFEWLIRGDGRRRFEAYAMFTSVAHERIVEIFGRHRNRFLGAGAEAITSDADHRAVWNYTFRDGAGKPTKSHRPTWEFDRTNGKGKPIPTADTFREIEGTFEYDVLYGELGSDIVHTGPFSLARTLQALGNRQTFILQPKPIGEACTNRTRLEQYRDVPRARFAN